MIYLPTCLKCENIFSFMIELRVLCRFYCVCNKDLKSGIYGIRPWFNREPIEVFPLDNTSYSGPII